MLQKVAKWRLFVCKTSHLRILSASAPHLLRSAKFCTFATDGIPHLLGCLSQIGISF